MADKFAVGQHVRIMDPNIVAGLPNHRYIPGMHGAIGTVKGLYEDLVSSKAHLPKLAGRYVIQINDIRVQSAFTDKRGIRRPDWYVLPPEVKESKGDAQPVIVTV